MEDERTISSSSTRITTSSSTTGTTRTCSSQDDYVPEIPTSKWEKGKEYTVKRRIYIPTFIDEFDPQFKGEEPLRLSVGFYNPYDRTGQSEQEVLSKKLKVVPPPIGTPEVIYESGWYDLETNPESDPQAVALDGQGSPLRRRQSQEGRPARHQGRGQPPGGQGPEDHFKINDVGPGRIRRHAGALREVLRYQEGAARRQERVQPDFRRGQGLGPGQDRPQFQGRAGARHPDFVHLLPLKPRFGAT